MNRYVSLLIVAGAIVAIFVGIGSLVLWVNEREQIKVCEEAGGRWLQAPVRGGEAWIGMCNRV